ncbi:MAG: YtxH domain-containing protein [Dysgonamonadaceae bacterium]|jgi:hypothetical protein|nr:YtxH domain-containing protein [Dysgonamonadaceae bacterium]
MKSEGKLLLGLGIGIALGAAIGYILGTDKKEEWLEQANVFVDKVKANVKMAVAKGQEGVQNLKEDIDDCLEITKKELSKH